MLINEIFQNIQGESRNLGKPSIFIRTQGCNVKCSFCDTAYTFDGSEVGTKMTVNEIRQSIKKYSAKHIVITGGEPLIQSDIIDLIDKLIKNDYTIEIETSGTVDISKFRKNAFKNCKFNVSPKLYSAMPKIKPNADLLIKYFLESNQTDLKFVIKNDNDWKEAVNIAKTIYRKLSKFSKWKEEKQLYGRCYFMPEGRCLKELNKNSRFIISRLLTDLPYANYTPRIQNILWENQRAK